MVRRLEQIARFRKASVNQYWNDLNAAHLREAIPRTQDPEALFQMWIQYPLELLRSGQTEAAIEAFDQLVIYLTRERPDFLRLNDRYLKLYRATAYLRLGEQANCLGHHTAESCMFPIQGGGVHVEPEGSRQAIIILQEILTEDPSDLSARWLLNLAYMTLGEYPEQVPESWRIDPGTFSSPRDIGRFRDVASLMKVNTLALSGGAILEDFDNDGWLDLVASSIGVEDNLRFFRNLGNGRFEDRTEAAGLLGLTGGLNLLQADYDNDGFMDILVLRGGWFGRQGRHPNSLLRNLGNGMFEDVTQKAGVFSLYPTQTAVWLDYNLDGWVDLFIGNESDEQNRHPCELYRNNGNGTFTECARESGVEIVGYVKAVVSADVDHDGRPDLYLSLLDAPNLLLRNLGPASPAGNDPVPWHFAPMTEAGVSEPVASFPAWFFDYDNDGWDDLFVAGYKADGVGEVAADYLGLPTQASRSRLYRNTGQGRFEDVSVAMGMHRVLLAMGSNFGDFDNDGWLDAYVGTGNPDMSMLVPNVALRNDAGGGFQDITTSSGLGHLQKGHGVAFGDIDHDGDQDIFANMGGAYTGDVYPNALFLNPGQGHHWITLKLEGRDSNRAALGARIKVSVMQEGGLRSICRTVRSGGSFGASPLRQEIGLGQAASIQQIEIFWPVTGKTQRLPGPALDRFYRVVEGAREAEPWELSSFTIEPPAREGGQALMP